MAGGSPVALRVQDLIRAYPGIHLREVARRLDIDVRAANHHLERLEKGGYLTARYFGKHKRYFPRRGKDEGEVVDRRDKLLLAHLRNPLRLSLVVHLIAFGPSRLKDLSRRVGISPSRASFHLRGLEQAGVVRRAAGDAKLYAIRKEDRLKGLLRAFRPMPDLVEDFLTVWGTLAGD